MAGGKNFKLVKIGCYSVNVAMAAMICMLPLLLVTFHERYDISYTLLGLLVLINFFSQLSIDLIFSFFSKHFNVKAVVRFMPLITIFGGLIYAVMPAVFPQNAYMWLAIGTVIISISCGLAEVLISPVVAAIPSDNPEREMSKLHSVYAWGVVAVVLLSSLFLRFVPEKYSFILVLLWLLVPLFSFCVFCVAKLPDVQTEDAQKSKVSGVIKYLPFVLCIFLGSAAENTMTQWVSGYVEQALGIPKIVGDVGGMAAFAVTMGLGRTFYAKFGKNISKVLFWGFLGSVICYAVAALSPVAWLSLIACALTGICTSMLWPGTLIYAAEETGDNNVTMYALLAAGGDLGASVAPQLFGVVTDGVSASGWGEKLAGTLGLTLEETGMKTGMLVTGLFPLVGLLLIFAMLFKKGRTARLPKTIE